MSKRVTILLLIAALLLVLALGATAGSDGYSLDWWTVDGGGVMEAGVGSYTLSATAGQADAGTLGGGEYTLYGGFWDGEVAHRAYLPLIVH